MKIYLFLLLSISSFRSQKVSGNEIIKYLYRHCGSLDATLQAAINCGNLVTPILLLMHPNTSGQRSLYRSYPSCAQLSGASCLPTGICRDARRVATRGEGHAYAHHVMDSRMTPGGTHAAGGTV